MLLTLGLFFITSDLVTIIWGRDFHTITPPGFLIESKVIFGHYYPAYRLAVIVVGLVIAIVTYWSSSGQARSDSAGRGRGPRDGGGVG